MQIYIPCSDGSDVDCEGKVTTDLPLLGLTDDDIEIQVVTLGGRERLSCVKITVSKLNRDQWVAANEDFLDADLKELIQKTGEFKVDADDIDQPVCAACGSPSSGEDDRPRRFE